MMDTDDTTPPADPRFDAWISGVAPHVNAPPPTPRGDMWDAIRAAQVTSVTPIRRARWIVPATIAATLLIGIGIGRVVTRHQPTTPVAVAVVKPAPNASQLYRLAAQQTLGQAEAFLTAFRASDMGNNDPQSARQLGAWGRDVLSSTRLLMDSPAGRDPQLKPLLNDLELVLVQIISASGAPLDSAERSMIDHAVREHDLLPRIRSAVPAGIAGSASGD